MFTTFASSIILSSVLTGVDPGDTVSGDELWTIDKQIVFDGGCLQIVFEAPSRIAHRFTMAIGDREPTRINRLGRSEAWNGQTVILLSHDIMGVLGDGGGSEARGKVTIPPILAEPGVVVLTMYIDGKPVGTKSIEVVEADQEARQAIELLFPIVDREALPSGREKPFLWMQLMLKPTFDVTSEVLQQLRDELPIIKQHPDWSEIAEMLMARIEARLHKRQLIESGGPLGGKIKDGIDVLPPWPDIVTRCLDAKPKSPFARAIQKSIEDSVFDLELLDAQRRGEDIFEMLGDRARVPVPDR